MASKKVRDIEAAWERLTHDFPIALAALTAAETAQADHETELAAVTKARQESAALTAQMAEARATMAQEQEAWAKRRAEEGAADAAKLAGYREKVEADLAKQIAAAQAELSGLSAEVTALRTRRGEAESALQLMEERLTAVKGELARVKAGIP